MVIWRKPEWSPEKKPTRQFVEGRKRAKHKMRRKGRMRWSQEGKPIGKLLRRKKEANIRGKGTINPTRALERGLLGREKKTNLRGRE